MSDDDPNTPLDFPVSDTEYYPEDVEISTGHKQSTRVWAPETLEIMERFGYHPEDMDTGSEDEEEDSDQETDEELEEAVNKSVKRRKVTLHLPTQRPPSKAGADRAAGQPVEGVKPSQQGRHDTSGHSKKLPTTANVPVKHKKRQADSEVETSDSDTDQGKKTPKKKRSKKKARGDEAEQHEDEHPEPPAKRKRGRPRKLVEEKAVAVSGSQPFNTSVFVSVDNPPQLIHGKTHKTDKHVAQEPRVEGPFTLIRSMKWSDFLEEVAVWVGVDKENLRVNGLNNNDTFLSKTRLQH